MHSQNPSPNYPLLHLLPKEIIEEILSRLPVKSLLKFRCVSKSWLSLIKSDRFIKIHFQNSRKNTTLAHHRIVFNENANAMNGCSLPSLLNSKEGSSSSIIIDPTNDQPETGFVVGCYNGVLCLTSNYADGDFSLWNPATRVSIELPKLDYIFTICGFGWDESTAAFKLLASTIPDSLNNKRSSQVYSSKTNSWKLVPPNSLKGDSLFSPFGVFVGGRLHWAMGRLPDDDHVIVSFNLENDEFERIELPPFNANAEEGCRPQTWLGEIGGCLCTLFDYEKCLDVWVMKEYGVKDSWFKLITFPLSVSKPTIFAFPLLIEEGPNGEMFIIYRHNFMVYSPKDDAFSTATNTIAFFGARIYVESLVSPQTNTR